MTLIEAIAAHALDITFDDGRTIARRIERALGRGSDNPPPETALHANFANCAGRALPPARAERPLRGLSRLDETGSLRAVVALTALSSDR